MSGIVRLQQHFRAVANGFLCDGDGWKYWVRQVPNTLSTSRLVIAFAIVFLSPLYPRWHRVVIVAALVGYVTDGLDGWLARRLHAESDYGKFVDPLADKFLVAAIVVYVLVVGNYNWVDLCSTAVIVCREVHVTYRRSKFADGARMLDPTSLSKWKAIFQYATTFVFLVPTPVWSVRSVWSSSLSVLLFFTALITCATWWEYMDPRGRKIYWGWLPSPALQFCLTLESWRRRIAGA